VGWVGEGGGGEGRPNAVSDFCSGESRRATRHSHSLLRRAQPVQRIARPQPALAHHADADGLDEDLTLLADGLWDFFELQHFRASHLVDLHDLWHFADDQSDCRCVERELV